MAYHTCVYCIDLDDDGLVLLLPCELNITCSTAVRVKYHLFPPCLILLDFVSSYFEGLGPQGSYTPIRELRRQYPQDFAMAEE